ncbi:MAG: thioredoxin domain-containing protein [Dehalococcoidia bacterium]
MSNRQARRDQMRNARNTAAQQRAKSARSAPGGPRRGGGGGGGGMDFLFRPFTLIVAGLVVVFIVVLGILIATSSDGGHRVDEMKKAREDLPLELANGVKLGKDDAPLKITMFEDFQCPFCLQYTADSEPYIVENYVKTGKVQLIWNNLPLLGAESVAAAKGSTCAADQAKFWEFHNKLYLVQAEAGQDKNEKLNAGRFTEAKLKEYAGDLGMDTAKFEACLGDPATLEKVTADNRKATQYGLRSTPSFLFNDQSIGSGALASNDDWKKAIDDYIEKSTASPTPSATGSTTPAASPTATRTP